jgi:four helix bundle protein
MQDDRKLRVWEEAHDLVLTTCRETKAFPSDERYGLTSQIRRSGVSVPSNIAEGCGRRGAASFGLFLEIATGSINEVDYQLLLAHDLEYLQTQRFEQMAEHCDHVRRMLIALRERVLAGS